MKTSRWLVVWFDAPGWPTGQRREQWAYSEKQAKKLAERVGGCVKQIGGRR